LLLLAPLQVLATWAFSAAACLALGLQPAGAAMIGLSIAMSSSVVVVNITRSRRRTTDARTDEVLLGWSLIQDLVGVGAALILVVVVGVGGRSGLAAVAGVLAFALPVRGRRVPPTVAAAEAADGARPVPARLCGQRPACRRRRVALLRHPARLGGIRRRCRHHRKSSGCRSPPAPVAVPRSLRSHVLRRPWNGHRPQPAASGAAVVAGLSRHGPPRQGAGRLADGALYANWRSKAPARSRTGPGRRVQLRARRPGSRGGPHLRAGE